jgi:hypothetical protein
MDVNYKIYIELQDEYIVFGFQLIGVIVLKQMHFFTVIIQLFEQNCEVFSPNFAECIPLPVETVLICSSPGHEAPENMNYYQK